MVYLALSLCGMEDVEAMPQQQLHSQDELLVFFKDLCDRVVRHIWQMPSANEAALSLTAGVSVEKVCTFFLFSIGIVLFIVSLLFRWRLSGCQCCPTVHQLSWNTLKGKLLLVCYEGFFCSEIIMHGKLKR